MAAYRPVERGRASLDDAHSALGFRRTFVAFLLLGVVAYFAWKFVPPWRTSLKVREVMDEVAFSANVAGDPAALNVVLGERLSALGVYPTEDPVWEWAADEVRVRVQYQLVVKHPVWIPPTTLDFAPEVKKPRNLGGS